MLSSKLGYSLHNKFILFEAFLPDPDALTYGRHEAAGDEGCDIGQAVFDYGEFHREFGIQRQQPDDAIRRWAPSTAQLPQQWACLVWLFSGQLI
jgi:hypothetical protein